MKYFPVQRRDHGSLLFDSAGITSDPLREKMDAIKRMKKDNVGRIFAVKTRPEEQALAQLIREQK